MAEYRFSARAQRDLDGIFDYMVAKWGLPQALLYTDHIATACAELAEAPRGALDCASIQPDYRRHSGGRHILYFRPTLYGIAIIRILHQRMDAARHL